MTRARGKHAAARRTTRAGREAHVVRLLTDAKRAECAATDASDAQYVRTGVFGLSVEDRPDVRR